VKPLIQFSSKIKYLFTDIDDTLTDEGLLSNKAYESLWQLRNQNILVVPVTGRPAGWCEMIARVWPVHAIIGENGAFYFKYDRMTKKMHRKFSVTEPDRLIYQKKLKQIQEKILTEIPGSALASDQFCRLFDLAIDFCEDVKPLSKESVLDIKKIFEAEGAIAKISSIHVNGWFGDYDKLSCCKMLSYDEWQLNNLSLKTQAAFVGDSPNDEPMFEFFSHSFGVANIKNFAAQIKNLPSYVSKNSGGLGFSEIADIILHQLKQ
jgi:HAD superfamily hydrolase (TIGR01484 family)